LARVKENELKKKEQKDKKPEDEETGNRIEYESKKFILLTTFGLAVEQTRVSNFGNISAKHWMSSSDT